MKKILKILLILAAALLLHLLAGSAGLFRAVGTQGQAAVRVCIWSGAGFFLGVDPARRRIMGIPDEGKI